MQYPRVSALSLHLYPFLLSIRIEEVVHYLFILYTIAQSLHTSLPHLRLRTTTPFRLPSILSHYERNPWYPVRHLSSHPSPHSPPQPPSRLYTYLKSIFFPGSSHLYNIPFQAAYGSVCERARSLPANPGPRLTEVAVQVDF